MTDPRYPDPSILDVSFLDDLSPPTQVSTGGVKVGRLPSTRHRATHERSQSTLSSPFGWVSTIACVLVGIGALYLTIILWSITP